mmetsp:Transcript_20771/g.48169  ORF Transcript_20771/g.48169 Transcript_20771/m.48169 type:complete len:204 (-) Transcript_20771:775-1386(-)
MLRRLGIVRARLRPTGPNEALLQHSVDHLGDRLRLSAFVVVLPNAHHRHDLRRPRDTSDELLEFRSFDGLQCAPQRLGLARWVHRLAHAARHHQILRVSARRVVEHLGTRQQRILACECKAYLEVVLPRLGLRVHQVRGDARGGAHRLRCVKVLPSHVHALAVTRKVSRFEPRERDRWYLAHSLLVRLSFPRGVEKRVRIMVL